MAVTVLCQRRPITVLEIGKFAASLLRHDGSGGINAISVGVQQLQLQLQLELLLRAKFH